MTSKAEIVELLRTRDLAVARALLVLNERQTASEQASQTTQNRNGRGFRPCHARMGTSMAEFFQRRGYLSPKQLAYWRATMRDGKMRIEIYAGQLLEVAQARAQTRAIAQPSAEPVTASVKDVIADDDAKKADASPAAGVESIDTLREELMVLEEMYASESQRGADDLRLKQIEGRIEQIHDRINDLYVAHYKMARDAA